MPELPEVETVVRDLQELLTGQTLRSIEIFDPRVWFESELEPSAFVDQPLQSIFRRGKYIVYEFDQLHLIQHLRMTGKMVPSDSEAIPTKIAAAKGTNLQIRLELHFNQSPVVFYDTRRFGTFTAVRDLKQYWQKKKLAPDPLDKENNEALKIFVQKLKETRRPIKSALLDQEILCGAGNIYADEALHRAKIHPLTPADQLTEEQSRNIFRLLQVIFEEAIAKRGTTASDYFDVYGDPGVFKKYLRVYRRTGDDCKTCKKTVIEKITVAGRSTHFCPHCQKG